MRKILLMSSALVVSGLLSEVAEAACIQTPTCASLGYTSSSSCTGGTKCPFGNAWNCTVVDLTNKITEITNKITTIEEKITEIEENGGGSGTINYDCKIGNIVYSDKTCGSEPIEGKISIGVIFNEGNRLAIAKTTVENGWSFGYSDTPLANMNEATALGDWSGKYNTGVVWEYCQSEGITCPAFEYVVNYKTEGTSAGDWYLPALAELKAIYQNKEVLNETLAKIGGRRLPIEDHWSSSESSEGYAWVFDFYDLDFYDGGVRHSNKNNDYYVRPVLAF